MKHILMIIILAFFFTACAHNPKDVVAVKVGDEIYATDTAASVALTNKDSKEEIVCKKTAKTGTRLKTSICSTKRQIERDREEDRRRISDNIQNNATVNSINRKGG